MPASIAGSLESGDQEPVNVLVVSAPLFALVLLGYLATRSRLIPSEAVQGLNTYVLYFAMTAMLFRVGAQSSIEELLNPVVIVVWILACWTIIGLGLVPGLKSGLGWRTSGFAALAGAIPNAGFMGIPLIGAILGQHGLALLVPILLTDIVIIQSTGIGLAHIGAGGGGWRANVKTSLAGVLKNPLMWSIVLGAAWSTTPWATPEIIVNFLDLLADSATPVALFTIGAVLAREQRNARPGVTDTPKVYVGWLSLLKLLGLPVAAWLFGSLAIAVGAPLTSTDLAVLVLTAALPTAANVPILTERFRGDNRIVSTVLLATTALGFITFNAIAAIVA